MNISIQCNYPLVAHNTFGFAVNAERFVTVRTDDELLEALSMANRNAWPVFILGGGSNLVLKNDIGGLVIHPANDETHYVLQADGSTIVTAGAGKNWHQLVLETLAHGLVGLENLSLIPGNAGAAPVQNIGAYGVELNDRLHSVRAYHRPSGSWQQLQPEHCAFDYRDSVFKRNPGDYIITHVSFSVSPKTPLVMSYQALDAELQAHGVKTQPETDAEHLRLARHISQRIIALRQSKLPDPKLIGNAGSFFKNPVVEAAKAASLKERHPGLITYPLTDGRVKLAAGWMIDSLGYKGYRAGSVGVHTRQALVLVHEGGGSGDELMAVADEIIAKVDEFFGVRLEIEPIRVD